MTATPQAHVDPPPAAPRWGAGRVIALVFGVLLLLPALGLLAGGGVAALGRQAAARRDGYLCSPTDDFSSAGLRPHAASSIDLATGADWLPVSAALGTARTR